MRIFITLILIIFLNATSFTKTKEKLISTQKNISLMNTKLDKLAKKIYLEQKNLKKINQQIKNLNLQISLLQNSLKDSKNILSNLKDLKNGYSDKLNEIQSQIIDFISENYFNTILKPQNINDLINKEVTKEILKKYSTKIAKLLNQNSDIVQKIEKINNEINFIVTKQNELINKKKLLASLLKKQQNKINNLKKQKKEYKIKLQNLINKQKSLQNRLKKLKIITQKENKIKFEKVNINVKKIGSVYIKPKTAKYNGPKTIPPIKGKIIKKFGSYIDPIYNIRIYNDSITIKPLTPYEKVRSIFNGKIVFIGDTYGKKIIVIKHKNNLFSIYANLDKVSPILKKGYYVKKGQIIARVNDSLDFEVTYKEKPINPLQVIKLK